MSHFLCTPNTTHLKLICRKNLLLAAEALYEHYYDTQTKLAFHPTAITIVLLGTEGTWQMRWISHLWLIARGSYGYSIHLTLLVFTRRRLFLIEMRYKQAWYCWFTNGFATQIFTGGIN